MIGNHALVMGTLVHEFTRPHLPRGLIEPAPKIEDRAVVGFGATIVGGVTIGNNSYVAAGAVVTKDVPPKSIVVGVNIMCHVLPRRLQFSTVKTVNYDYDVSTKNLFRRVDIPLVQV